MVAATGRMISKTKRQTREERGYDGEGYGGAAGSCSSFQGPVHHGHVTHVYVTSLIPRRTFLLSPF